MISKIFFTCHKLGIIVTTFGWIVDKRILFLHVPVMMSWYFNDNKCLLSQLEYRLFGKTFLGDGPKFYVPGKYRLLLYANFFLGLNFK